SGFPSVLVYPGRIASTDLVDGTHMRTCPGLLRIAEIAGTVLVSHSIVSAVSKLRLVGFIFGAVLIDLSGIVVRQVLEIETLENAIDVIASPTNGLLGPVAIPRLIGIGSIIVAPDRLGIGVSIANLFGRREVQASAELRLLADVAIAFLNHPLKVGVS